MVKIGELTTTTFLWWKLAKWTKVDFGKKRHIERIASRDRVSVIKMLTEENIFLWFYLFLATLKQLYTPFLGCK